MTKIVLVMTHVMKEINGRDVIAKPGRVEDPGLEKGVREGLSRGDF